MRQHLTAIFVLALIAIVAFGGDLYDGLSEPAPALAEPVIDPTNGSFCDGAIPIAGTGAQPNQPANLWCYDDLNSGPSTFQEGPNSWLDSFNHGLSLADCCAGYFFVPDVANKGGDRAVPWRHANHMMVDEQHAGDADHNGGSALRPSRTFRFQDRGDGRGPLLIVEFSVSARITSYDTGTGEGWPEFVISTASNRRGAFGDPNGGTDAYQMREYFATNAVMFGCYFRNQDIGSRSLSCDGTGTSEFFLSDNNGRICTAGLDPDAACRDHFRFEIAQNSLRYYVNGSLQDTQGGNVASSLLVNSDVYVYFGQFHYRFGVPTSRWHWDDLGVNADLLEAGPIPTSTMTPVPTATSTPLPAATPIPPNNRCRYDNGDRNNANTGWQDEEGVWVLQPSGRYVCEVVNPFN